MKPNQEKKLKDILNFICYYFLLLMEKIKSIITKENKNEYKSNKKNENEEGDISWDSFSDMMNKLPQWGAQKRRKPTKDKDILKQFNDTEEQKKKTAQKPFYKTIWFWIIAPLAVIFIISAYNNKIPIKELNFFSGSTKTANLDEQKSFIAKIESLKGLSAELTIDNSRGIATLIVSPAIEDRKIAKFEKIQMHTGNSILVEKELIDAAKKAGISIKYDSQPGILKIILIRFLPWILVGIVVWIIISRKRGTAKSADSKMRESTVRFYKKEEISERFSDVAGIDHVLSKAQQLVEYLKNPEKYTRLGGKIPKGTMLTGGPGVGKTLIARAVAGEAGVPFGTCSGSDFDEMYVGVGSSRVRDLFKQARKNAPCIIFIDEIDAVGKKRGRLSNGERDKTLNALLVEMDGFAGTEGIIWMAATNRPDTLDSALLRPGRFDRQIDIKQLAKVTPGWSGAMLANWVNLSTLLAVEEDAPQTNILHFLETKEAIIRGEKSNMAMTEKDVKTVAYHEAGHALVARLLPYTEIVENISIIPRGNSGGATWFVPRDSKFSHKEQFINDMAVGTGGQIAEKIVNGYFSQGASNDIKQVTNIASRMVRELGMSKNLGFLNYSSDEQGMIIGDMYQGNKPSQKTKEKIDQEILELAKTSYKKAEYILNQNKELLNEIAEVLIKKETITGKELDEIIRKSVPDFEKVHE